MYNPEPFAEDQVDVMHAFLRRHPLATVVTCGINGPEATHAPAMLHAETGPNGILRCHFARANGHWKSLRSSAALAIFQNRGHYVSPSWYPSRKEHGRVVPTWNYLAVHVRGIARVFEDPAEIVEHVRALTDFNERIFEKPWSVDDAPRDYIEALSRAIVGVEIPIDSIEGKWKVSQNRGEADRRGVAEALRRDGSASSREMASFIEQRGFKEPQ
jgi:transcriptional regulator